HAPGEQRLTARELRRRGLLAEGNGLELHAGAEARLLHRLAVRIGLVGPQQNERCGHGNGHDRRYWLRNWRTCFSASRCVAGWYSIVAPLPRRASGTVARCAMLLASKAWYASG